MAAQAKLMAALKKKADDDDAPRPELAPIAPSADRDTLKLKKSNLLGAVTFESVQEKLEYNNKHDFTQLFETLQKMFGNVISYPDEPKYRTIKHTNPNFTAKVYSCKGAPELFELTKWKKDSIEDGFLVLPDGADPTLLSRALDMLKAQAEARAVAEEKKRKLDNEKAAKARVERAQKAAAQANPSAYDAAVASASNSSMMADEDEAMIEAIEEYMESQQSNALGPYDHFEIERQVPGAGAAAGTVVASVAASKGVGQYDDLLCFMKRDGDGAWTVSKVERAS